MSWNLWRNTIVKMSDLTAVTDNLKFVREKIAAASGLRTPELRDICPSPRLVAVSKTKPKDCIIQAYVDGQRHFGENYIQELVDKAVDPHVREACPEIKFHFIGHLQRNKISKLLSVSDKIFLLETVDSEALAKSVNDGMEKREITENLNVMVQVNTSGEESKSGIEPDQCIKLANFIITQCSRLKFKGLMTIGALASNHAEPNQDFKLLFNLREDICKELNLKVSEVELSMGMSGDYEEAIELGSTNVRIGSTIFGPRQKLVNK